MQGRLWERIFAHEKWDGHKYLELLYFIPQSWTPNKIKVLSKRKRRWAIGLVGFRVCHVLPSLSSFVTSGQRKTGGVGGATSRGRKRYSQKLITHDDWWFLHDQNDTYSPVRQTKSSQLFCSPFAYNISEDVLSFKIPLL